MSEALTAFTIAPRPVHVKRVSVTVLILLTVVTGGLYYPSWFLLRRASLNELDSPRKLPRWPFVLFLVLHAIRLVISILLERPTGAVDAQRFALSRADAVLGLVGFVLVLLLVFQSFAVKDILEDHLTGVHADPVLRHITGESRLSGLLTFFFGIFYLQYAINTHLEAEAAFDPATLPGADPVYPPERFSFAGTGAEYFRIWIVNVLLSIVTLGIYSAWAKVRRLQYFYRNTRLAGTGFDYHGDPIAILKGRLIAGTMIGVYYGVGLVSPVLQAGALILGALILPWLLVRSFRFRFYNSSYRGLRFQFTGSTAGSYQVFLGLPVLSALSLLTLVPYWHHQMKRYQHGNAVFGRSRFTFDAPVSGFYGTYLAAAGVLTGVIGGAVILVLAIGVATAAMGAGSPEAAEAGAMVVFLAAYGVAIVCVSSFVTARVQNLVWNHTALGRHTFACRLRATRVLAITLTNLIGVLLTVGLFRPFAQVRLACYVADSLWLVPAGTLDEFVTDDQQEVAALGEEAAGMLDIDIAF